MYMSMGLVLAVGILAAQGQAPTGAAPQGYVGALFADAVDFNGAPMIVIADIIPSSPAQWHGLRPGDVVKSINGAPPGTLESLRDRIRESTPADTLTFVVGRGRGVKAITVQVGKLTPALEAALARRAVATTNELSAGAHPVIYLPEKLCYQGVTYGEALVLTVAPGATTVPLSELQGCRHPVSACAPLALLEQSKSKTLVFNGAIKYKLKGDWRAVSFATEDACRKAIQGQPEQQ